MADTINVTEMTQEGKEARIKELNERKIETRNAISEQMKFAKSLGDFSENAELDAAKAAYAENEKAIERLEYELATAVIIKPKNFIILEKENNEIVDVYICKLVGETESDFLNHLISNSTPFGLEVVKHKKGDEFAIHEFKFTILEDEPKKVNEKELAKYKAKYNL